MMKESKDRDFLKERIRKWMYNSSVDRQTDALDMAVLETFFYIYYSLEEGSSIHEIGNSLGVFPVP